MNDENILWVKNHIHLPRDVLNTKEVTQKQIYTRIHKQREMYTFRHTHFDTLNCSQSSMIVEEKGVSGDGFKVQLEVNLK